MSYCIAKSIEIQRSKALKEIFLEGRSIAQVLKYFMVNDDLETLHFIVYTDVIPELELQVFDIKRKDVEERLSEAKAFETETLKRANKLAERIERLSF